MSHKPTIVLVHGAFHGPEAFHLIKPKLEALGYPVVAVALASVGTANPTATYLDDVGAIHEEVLPIIDEGKEVILVTQYVLQRRLRSASLGERLTRQALGEGYPALQVRKVTQFKIALLEGRKEASNQS